MMPDRVQLSRRAGWRMPLNTVRVSRPSKFGNPFTTTAAIKAGLATPATARTFVVDRFRIWLNGDDNHWSGPESNAARNAILAALPELKGKHLACWCSLDDQPCHADVLLDLANG